MAQATIATTVTGLQGHPVSNTAPSVVGQLLTWNGSAWAPDNTTYMPVAGGTFTGPVTLAGAATEANQPATLTQVATAAGVNIGRNFIHNGRFVVNQRGSASYAPIADTFAYTVDRWGLGGAVTGDSLTVTQAVASDADRAAVGDENVEFYYSSAFTGGTGATNSISFGQRIEDVYRLSNKQLTLSFWAYSPTSQRLGVSFFQYMGSGGSPSATIYGNIGVAALTTGWARYQFTFTMPSMAGQTIGTTVNSDYTGLLFWVSCPPANTGSYPISGNLGAQSGTINIWGVQLEVGSQATPFEHQDPEYETAQCLRFYQNFFYQATTYSGGTAGGVVGPGFTYLQYMRAPPTIIPVTANMGGNTTGVGFGSIGPATGSITLVVTTEAGIAWWNGSFYMSADL